MNRLTIDSRGQRHGVPLRGGLLFVWNVLVAALALLNSAASNAASNTATTGFARFESDILPILKEYCFDCHGDGMNKGKVAFDEFKTPDELLARKELWLAVLKNVRAGMMPPEKKPRPSEEQKRTLADWIKRDAFGIDANDPDPGRVTVRRLNRVEYRNTIRDLTGFDFKVEEELPPDDTGFGFDNIGDVLTLSPLLLEKYMQAAETIAAGAVPRVTRVVAEKTGHRHLLGPGGPGAHVPEEIRHLRGDPRGGQRPADPESGRREGLRDPVQQNRPRGGLRDQLDRVRVPRPRDRPAQHQRPIHLVVQEEQGPLPRTAARAILLHHRTGDPT